VVVFLTDNRTTPTKVVFSCFGLLVGLWKQSMPKTTINDARPPLALFILVSSCKNLKPCDNPFWDFNNRGKNNKNNKKSGKIPKT
jgi:hypothetical protein